MDILRREKLNVFLSLENTKTIEADLPISLLNYFENSFLPRPTRLDIMDRRSEAIQSFTDETIVQALKTSESVQLETEDYALRVGFETMGGNYISITIKEDQLKGQRTVDLKTFAFDLIKKTNPVFASVCFDKITAHIEEKHFGEDTEYEDVDIAPWYWLNYFGAEEFAKRGGEALYGNPHIEVKKMGEGVLVQIGESPYDAYTPEGEARLVAAIKAMPPYQRR